MANSDTVLVVGGGVTGAGVARDLSLRGVDVVLAERDGLSSGTSSRSHGLLHSGARYAESDLRGAEECIQENRILKSTAGACIRDTGGLFVQLAADDPAYFERKREACADAAIETELLDADAVRETVPELSATVERALWVPDAVVFPSRLVATNAADAAAHGARILPHSPLESLRVRNEQVVSAQLGGTADETIEPDYVVNAAGAWAGQVAAMAGLEVTMAPSRGVMISVAYDQCEPVLNRCRVPDDGDIVVPHDGEVVLGTTSVPASDPDDCERADWEVETCIEECAAMLPPVADAEITRTWWGVRPLYAPDEAGQDRRGISRGYSLLDHAMDDVENVASIVGGKLTTYRRMAAATADLVCDRLGVAADCVTADRPLPGHDDPARLDEYVARFDSRGPTDADIVS
ncbi:FAD-dependent oxidoreductase [Halorientalis regularis]|uniref:Glycerol-3-phosphate dehydrogenase n=1 Tax=Halorientalis regularis TaxID=660518 RepID=A0A1G7SXU6_9EURY|nr:FAD-dependent oxidoreductase [Halorientalis regularis]SDG27801.1 glycerol-3-phosphate dehydrogenase [Halorientalis regularis]